MLLLISKRLTDLFFLQGNQLFEDIYLFGFPVCVGQISLISILSLGILSTGQARTLESKLHRSWHDHPDSIVALA